jgi:hypothetical protein
MSLEQASLLSQIAAAVALVVSLVFVGLQIRQNTRSQKVVAVDSLAAAIAAINVPAMESPALGEALSRAMHNWGSATREQRIVAHYFLFSFFKLSESAWYQQRAKVLDPTQWIGWETLLRAIYHSEGVQTGWWPRRHLAYSPELEAYLAQTPKPPADIGTLNDLFDNVEPGGAHRS